MGGPKKLYANQKHISFQNVPRNTNNPYNTYNQSAIEQASRDLSHSALKLYIYLGKFRNLEGIYLSRQDVLHTMGLSDKSYFSAFKELKEKGYLTQDGWDTNKDNYIFYESP